VLALRGGALIDADAATIATTDSVHGAGDGLHLQELELFIGKCYHPRGRTRLVRRIAPLKQARTCDRPNQLLTLVAHAPASSCRRRLPFEPHVPSRRQEGDSSPTHLQHHPRFLLLNGPLGPRLHHLRSNPQDWLDGKFHCIHSSASCPLCCQENERGHGHSAPTDARAWLHPQCLLF
jgi:hypothetical protein